MSGGWTAEVPEVSVIMPTHRCGRLRLSPRSALAQRDAIFGSRPGVCCVSSPEHCAHPRDRLREARQRSDPDL